MRYDEIPCTAAVLIMESRLASSGAHPAPETFVPILYPARLKKLFARNRVIWLPFLDLCEALAVLRGSVTDMAYQWMAGQERGNRLTMQIRA